MKKVVAFFLLVCLMFAFANCKNVEQPKEEEYNAEEVYKEFKAKFNETDAIAINPRIEETYDGRKILLADIKDNSVGNEEITDIVISFAAWRKDGTFVVIKSENNPDNKSEIFEITLNNVTISGGEFWKADEGVYLDENGYKIKYIEAIVASCKIGGKEYKNPLYDEWKEWFVGKDLEKFIRKEKDEAGSNIITPLSKEESFAEFSKRFDAQDALALNTVVSKEDEEGSVLLLTDIKNNLKEEIKSITVGFAAWDADGNPIKIKIKDGNSEENYLKVIGYGDVTVGAEQLWVAKTETDIFGCSVANENIATVKAIVVSYTKNDGTVVNNILYSEWVEYFVGNKLEEYMKTKQ